MKNTHSLLTFFILFLVVIYKAIPKPYDLILILIIGIFVGYRGSRIDTLIKKLEETA